jgi:integrase
LERLDNVKTPVGWHDCAIFRDTIQNSIRLRSGSVLEIPRNHHRAMQHKTHEPLLLISSLIDNPSSLCPFRRCLMRVAAAWARCLSKFALGDVSRAAGRPRRVMMTSSPASTQSSSWPSFALASNAPISTLKGIRDRAILATLLYHGLRRGELCAVLVGDMHSREGVVHFRIHGKGEKTRFIPVNPAAQRLIEAHLERSGHRDDVDGPLFRPVANNRTGELNRPLDPASLYQNVIRKYGKETGIDAEVIGLRVHSLRATAATNALSHDADIAKVQEWLGHANVSTTRLYDRRKSKPEDSPTFRIRY